MLTTLRDDAGLHPTLADVLNNRFGLRIRRVNREKLFVALNTASFVAMNAEDAARFGLMPGRDSIGIEDARSPYQHVLAVRTRDAHAAWVAHLISAWHSDEVGTSCSRSIRIRCEDPGEYLLVPLHRLRQVLQQSTGVVAA